MTVAAPARSKWRIAPSWREFGTRRRAAKMIADADRHVDEEDPLPGEAFDQEAAEQQADGAAARGDPGPDGERFGALRRPR